MESNHNENNKLIKNIMLIVGIPLLIIILSWVLLMNADREEKPPYSEYISYFEDNKVEEFVLDLNNGKLEMLLREEYRTDENNDNKIDKDDVIKYTVPEINLFYDNIKDIVKEANNDDTTDNDIVYDYKPQQQMPWFVSMIPTLLVAAFVIVMVVMMRRSLSGMDGGKAMSFGKARVKQPVDEKRKTTFADVAEVGS